MSRVPGPRAPLAAGNAAAMRWALAAGWGLVALTWLIWAAARVAALLSGGHVSPFGAHWIGTLVRGHAGRAWPGTPTPLVACLAVMFLAGMTGSGTLTWRAISRRLPPPHDPVAALRRNPGIIPLTPTRSARTATRLRASLAHTSLPIGIGDLRRYLGLCGIGHAGPLGVPWLERPLGERALERGDLTGGRITDIYLANR